MPVSKLNSPQVEKVFRALTKLDGAINSVGILDETTGSLGITYVGTLKASPQDIAATLKAETGQDFTPADFELTQNKTAYKAL